MAQLQLDDQEAAALKQVLESTASDLGYEIANTDSKDFREKLKTKRALLQRLIGQLGGA